MPSRLIRRAIFIKIFHIQLGFNERRIGHEEMTRNSIDKDIEDKTVVNVNIGNLTP